MATLVAKKYMETCSSSKAAVQNTEERVFYTYLHVQVDQIET